MQKRKGRIREISVNQWKNIDNCKDLQCGLTGGFSRKIVDIPDKFKNLLKNRCIVHDLIFRRGGNLGDFIKGNYYLIIYSLYDIFIYLIYTDKPIINRIINFISFLFQWLVMIFSVFTVGIKAFNGGKYKSLEKILSEAKKNYIKNKGDEWQEFNNDRGRNKKERY